MTSESFKVMYEEVVRGFESICGGFYVHHCINRDQSSPNLFPDALSNRFLEEAGRLRMWARNVGAHRQGKVSLDHRLREASQVRSMVAQILQDIKRFLNQAYRLILNPTEPDEMESDPDSETETDMSSSQEDPAADNGLSDLHFICADISHAISALYQLSILIQNPASRQKIYDFAKIDVSHFYAFEKLRIQDKYPCLPNYLTERLVKANLTRRQYFIYTKSHHERIAMEEEEGNESLAARSQTAATTFHPPMTTPNHLQIVPDNLSDGCSIGTTTSIGDDMGYVNNEFNENDAVADSTAIEGGEVTCQPETIRISIPPPPKLSQSSDPVSRHPKFFLCPYCYKIVYYSGTRSWRKHVLTDLQPYICTFESCPHSQTLFTRRQEWYNHELQFHRREWLCRAGSCKQRFRSQALFQSHLQLAHSDLPSMSVASSDHEALDMSYQQLLQAQCEVDAALEQKCPFCQVPISGFILRSHLARHLVDVALFTLPKELVEDEDQEKPRPRSPATVRSEQTATTLNFINDGLEQGVGDISYRIENLKADTYLPEDVESVKCIEESSKNVEPIVDWMATKKVTCGRCGYGPYIRDLYSVCTHCGANLDDSRGKANLQKPSLPTTSLQYDHYQNIHM